MLPTNSSTTRVLKILLHAGFFVSGIATVIIFQFMGTWNEFMFSTTFISRPELKTLQPALYAAVGRYSTDWTALSAGLIMSIIPIIIVYILLQSQFIKGLTAGAVKG